jgi:hypothetical protein
LTGHQDSAIIIASSILLARRWLYPTIVELHVGSERHRRFCVWHVRPRSRIRRVVEVVNSSAFIANLFFLSDSNQDEHPGGAPSRRIHAALLGPVLHRHPVEAAISKIQRSPNS